MSKYITPTSTRLHTNKDADKSRFSNRKINIDHPAILQQIRKSPKIGGRLSRFRAINQRFLPLFKPCTNSTKHDLPDSVFCCKNR